MGLYRLEWFEGTNYKKKGPDHTIEIIYENRKKKKNP